MDSILSSVLESHEECYKGEAPEKKKVNYDEFKKFADGCQYCKSCYDCIFPDDCGLYASDKKKKHKNSSYATEFPVSDKSPSLVKNSTYISRRRGRLRQLKEGRAKICGEALIDGIRLVIYKGMNDTYWAMNGKEYIEIPAKYIKDKWIEKKED